MKYFNWTELEELTDNILGNVFQETNFLEINNYDFNYGIGYENNLSFSTYTTYNLNDIDIEYQWTKWKILVWLQEAWHILNSCIQKQYYQDYKFEIFLSYLSFINLYFSYFIDWKEYFYLNSCQYIEILNNIIDSNYYCSYTELDDLWDLMREYKKNVIKILSKHSYYGNRQNLYLSISKSAEIKLNKDYIYYSLEDLYVRIQVSN